jgi:hypothetical protein
MTRETHLKKQNGDKQRSSRGVASPPLEVADRAVVVSYVHRDETTT